MSRFGWLASFIPGLFIAALPAGGIWAQTTKNDARLLDKPDGVPKGVPVQAGSAVKVLERQGFWLRIEAQGQAGWIKASGLSFSSGSGAPTAIDTGRLGKGNIVATSAARGLSSKDLLEGKPRPEELAKLANLAPTPQELKQFAEAGGVLPRAGNVALKVPDEARPGESTKASKPPAATPADSSKRSDKKANDDW